LNVLELDRAAETMLKHNFRHVPIVYESEGGRTHVAGVISMRDLFRGLVDAQKKQALLNQYQHKRVLVLAHSRFERELQKKLLEGHVDLICINDDFEAKAPDAAEIFQQVLVSDLFVMDLDHFSGDFWVTILKKVLAEKARPPVFVVFDPVHQDPRSVQALKQLSQGSVLNLFPKPINLLEYLKQMEKGLKGSAK
jgi:hypothetical protein